LTHPRKNLLPLRGIEPQFISHLAHRLVNIHTTVFELFAEKLAYVEESVSTDHLNRPASHTCRRRCLNSIAIR